MRALPVTWFEEDDPRDLRRWAVAALIVAALHLGAVATYVYIHRPDEIGDDTAPVAVELAPSDDTVDQPAIEPTPEQPPPPEEQPKPVEEQPPPPPPSDTSEAVVAPPPVEKPVEPPPPPPAAPPQAARIKGSSPRVEATWLSAIARHLARHAPAYPSEAAARNEAGIVHLGFRVDHAGRVYNLHIVRSSGHPDLDKAALTMIDKAQPFPPMPATIESDTDLEFPLRFDTHR